MALDWRGAAVLSEDRRHRFSLTRTRKDAGPAPRRMTWVMLNPSTADEDTNDQTIVKCMGFAQRLGFAELTVVNLFAFRARNPDALRGKLREDAVGEENDRYITAAAASSAMTICAWGIHGGLFDRGAEVGRMLANEGVDMRALDVSAGGQPGHPLFLPYSLEPSIRWSPDHIRRGKR